MDVTQPRNAGMDGHEQALDLTRGIAAYVNHPLVAGLARVIARHPQADIANAFNHKQVACKMWALDKLFDSCGGRFGRIWVLGGWYGVLPAMLFNDAR
ncbi:MAG: class I SAM-dependent methyltransferase, partial [Mesorhizobium sp.]